MRLDRALVARGLARSRTQAQTAIGAGAVRVDGAVVTRASFEVADEARVEAAVEAYVSRAAYKLIGALDDLDLQPTGRALDAGSSTGGFTQVLLERGCREVVAVDVGTDQLAPTLRADPRVRVHERTNLRDLSPELIGGSVDLVVADVSFISLRLLVEPLSGVLAGGGWMLLMVKPQFEVGRDRLGAGGVVRDPALRREAVAGVITAASGLGWTATAAATSHLPGPAGNREYFVCFSRHPPANPIDLDALVAGEP